MNEERLYINGNQIDLLQGFKLTKTLQVNDVSSVENRQASFTRSITIPKTPNNISTLDFLGVNGNTSQIPYQKNEIDYFIGNECVIYKGWGVINQTDSNGFDLVVYDGVVDFYKAIENKTFFDVNLSGLTHDKTVTNVIDTWVSGSTLPYRYIMADYNGKATYNHPSNGTTINTDYLIPSVNVKWLWDKVFDAYQFTYTGTIFDDVEFTNLWMTFPKGITSDEGVSYNLYETNNVWVEQHYPNSNENLNKGYWASSTPSVNNLENVIANSHYKVNESGSYKISITGKVKIIREWLFGRDEPTWGRMKIGKNQVGVIGRELTPYTTIGNWFGGGEAGVDAVHDIEAEVTLNLNAHDTICLFLDTTSEDGNGFYNGQYGNYFGYNRLDEIEPITLKIEKVGETTVDFNNELADFKLKDFINEIVWRFGLTLFKDKNENNIDFLTLDERLQTDKIIDWSDNFQGVKTEKYILPNYAQNNIFKYTYNDAKNDHKDGQISIVNSNLDDSKVLINSKIYAPEKELSFELGKKSNVYKFWNKEVSENDDVQTIKYKGLDKRFYFLKSEPYAFSGETISVGSEVLNVVTGTTNTYFESSEGIDFESLIDKYYRSYQRILNDSKIITVSVRLSAMEIADFDFKKLYYIEQLYGYFIVNKINNWQEDKLCNAELIKVDYTPYEPTIQDEFRSITLTNFQIISYDAFTKKLIVDYTTESVVDTTINVLINGEYYQTSTNQSPVEVFVYSSGFFSTNYIQLQSIDGQVTSGNSFIFSS